MLSLEDSAFAGCVHQGDFGRSVAVLEVAPLSENVSIGTRARVLNQKAFALSRSGDFVEAKEAIHAASRLASNACSRSLIAEIEINRAVLFFYLARYDEVETCAQTALKIAKEDHLPMVEASARASIGKSYMYRERQADAISWFQDARAIYAREGATFHADIMRSELGGCPGKDL